MNQSPATRPIPHGGVCECELLAAAMGMAPGAVSFDFCRRVLQKHWRVSCRHGGSTSEPVPPAGRWKDLGDTDAVKAILISNAPDPD